MQFGFKENVGCADAIFTLKSTVEYFVDRGGTVYIASLDISKAFDRVHHYKMYNSLLTAGVPVIIVDVLCNWYSKISFAVRWNSKLSARFAAGIGGAAGELFVASNIQCVYECVHYSFKTLEDRL